MKNSILISLILVPVLLCGCNEEGQLGETPAAPVSGEIVIDGLNDTEWTYFSFEAGQVVGRSTFLSQEEDDFWKARTDWDFAICGDYLKTNGGASGNGSAGVLRDETSNFLLLEEAPSEGYLLDEVGVVRE